MARDVTELRRMQTRLVHQEKLAALGMLSAGLAHEIGNPLASMSSELELLELCWDPEQARDSVPVLREQVRRMSDLLRELADFGRRSRHEQDDVDAGDIVRHAVRLLKHDKRARGVDLSVHLSVDLGADLPRIRVSQDRIIQVLVNLGINALDALGGQGKLSFSTKAIGPDAVAIEVSDDGPGMTEEVARHVFDPFYTTKAPGVGTGLGLFVSEQIVRGQGGHIELHTLLGGGTRFVVILPAAQAALGPGPGGEE
ncbi:MAG: hypothetical protein GXP62_09050 [Oligoflexia bacterium]|nr:hypothetical protein [Oligoflexia bacterium]